MVPTAPAPCLPEGVGYRYGWPLGESEHNTPRSYREKAVPEHVERPTSVSYDGEAYGHGEHGAVDGLEALTRLLSQIGG